MIARCSDAALTVAKLAQDKDIAASSVINAMLEAEEEFRAFRAQEKERLKQEKAGKAAKEKEEKERLKKEKAEKVAKDKEDKDRMTALGLATKGGHHAAVQLLLKAGADLTAKNKVSLKRGTLRHPSHRSEVHAGGAGPSNLTRISHDFCCSSGHDCPLQYDRAARDRDGPHLHARPRHAPTDTPSRFRTTKPPSTWPWTMRSRPSFAGTRCWCDVTASRYIWSSAPILVLREQIKDIIILHYLTPQLTTSPNTQHPMTAGF